MQKVLLSTGKDDWGTPQRLYDALNKEFGFTMDACADESNFKREKEYIRYKAEQLKEVMNINDRENEKRI